MADVYSTLGRALCRLGFHQFKITNAPKRRCKRCLIVQATPACFLRIHDWHYRPEEGGGATRTCLRCPAEEILSAAEVSEAAWEQMTGL